MNKSILFVAIVLSLAACKKTEPDQTAAAASNANKPSAAEAAAFIDKLGEDAKALYPEINAAQWVAATYINQDSQMLAAKTNERFLSKIKADVEAAKKFDGVPMSETTSRALKLLKLSMTAPAPSDAKKLGEMTQLATKLEGDYGAAKYCKEIKGQTECKDLGQLSETLAKSRNYDEQLDAWMGWSNTAAASRKNYQQFTSLSNEGAKELGFKDTGDMWRAGYDMDSDAFAAETDRLWGQVKPLYDQLHCYTKNQLVKKYGDKGQINGMIPAHLTGNMWAQQWGNLWDVLQPYPKASNLNVDAGLVKQGYDHKKMVERAEDFYTSIGMPKLPESFWNNSQFLQPRDRDVVCHASAWDMNMQGDVRIKMCIKPTEDEFTTIYHELGHVYYYLAYNNLPPIFQSGAHDGFHEAIGDTTVLSLTPGYLSSIGVVPAQTPSDEAVINNQLKMALDKVAFLPFGLLIDRWRWGVFDGSITPEQYNQAWWDLRAKYQGIAPAIARGEDQFDPGAKYHVPGNTPYTRYFLAHILQFQFHKALCDAAGYKGPLHECSIYGNKEAGAKFWAMLQKGQSQAWPQTMKEITGGEQMDASAILDYFAPLNDWLKKQNENQQCGWTPPA